MRYGIVVPSMLAPETIVELGVSSERLGWDGVFVWDTLLDYDVWVLLTAVAMRTERIRLGPIVTPVARHIPWRLANETATLDRLCSGRLILMVGLGVAEDEKWHKLGMVAEMDRRVRARKLDEGLAVIEGIWSGKSFSFSGEHYQISDVRGKVAPRQSPRIPVWVTGLWPDPPGTMRRRMARWDGIIVGDNPDTVRSLLTFLSDNRTEVGPVEIVTLGNTFDSNPVQAAARTRMLADAGSTWWIEDVWTSDDDLPRLRRRIESGPPRHA
jgi:alkanesulfonate monooxygenase SsuD/methylene tetrahydromethanopterin reductase-like flavin-dependent oxidoreductase (luciferase family)